MNAASSTRAHRIRCGIADDRGGRGRRRARHGARSKRRVLELPAARLEKCKGENLEVTLGKTGVDSVGRLNPYHTHQILVDAPEASDGTYWGSEIALRSRLERTYATSKGVPVVQLVIQGEASPRALPPPPCLTPAPSTSARPCSVDLRSPPLAFDRLRSPPLASARLRSQAASAHPELRSPRDRDLPESHTLS